MPSPYYGNMEKINASRPRLLRLQAISSAANNF